MLFDIQATRPADLPELGAFLTAGFKAPADAPFAAEDVLRWKYFDPRGTDAGDGPRSLVARHPETGAIVGHIGVTPGKLHGPGLTPDGLPTLHMMDWLSSEAGRGSGASLMRRANRGAVTQYGLGGSKDAHGVGIAGGYDFVNPVPVYLNVLRPLHRLKTPGLPWPGRALRVANDLARRLRRPARAARLAVDLRRVESFGQAVVPVVDAYGTEAIFTSRGPDLLNHLLRFPRGGVTGWEIWSGSSLRGYGLLAVVPRPGGVREGRVVDCLLDDPADAPLWHAAALALTRLLKTAGADTAIAFASTPWAPRAFEAAGYVAASPLGFWFRDRKKLIPRDCPVHLSPVEADYAYT